MAALILTQALRIVGNKVSHNLPQEKQRYLQAKKMENATK